MSGGGGSPSPYGGPDPFGDPSGFGAGTAGGGARPAGGTTTDCASLRFHTRLWSVDPGEVELISVGDVLEVSVFTADRAVIGAFRVGADDTLAEQPVGVIQERILNLLPCLNELGFVAVVKQVDGGSVTVLVEACRGLAKCTSSEGPTANAARTLSVTSYLAPGCAPLRPCRSWRPVCGSPAR